MLAWAAPPPSPTAAPAGNNAAKSGASGGTGTAAAAGTHDVVENYPDSKLHIRYQTDVAGLKTGQYLELFPNGRPKVRGSYLADKKQGIWTTLDQAGKTLESAGYNKGVLEGPYQWTAENGSASMRTTYHLGSYAGPVTVLGDRGRLILTARYPRPLDEIQKQWAALYPATIEPAKYAKEPDLSPPYVAGALARDTLEEALKRATNPNEFKLKIQGIQSTSDVAREEMDAALEAPSDFNPMQEESPFDFSNQLPPGRG